MRADTATGMAGWICVARAGLTLLALIAMSKSSLAQTAPPSARLPPVRDAAQPPEVPSDGPDPPGPTGDQTQPPGPATPSQPAPAPAQAGPAQPYPYPYPPYPPPYGYPPPPAQQQPAVRPGRVRYPDDTAARTSPFLDLLVAGYNFNHRFGYPFSPGAQLGVFVAARLRIAGRLVLLIEEVSDDNSSFSSGFQPLTSESPSLLWGGSIGVAAASTETFVLSPSLVFMSTDEPDYGVFLGAGLPFEWVTTSGLRIGFELDLGRAMGGTVRKECNVGFVGPGMTAPCSQGEVRDFDREPGGAFYVHFQIGWGFSRPDPISTPP